MHRDFGTVFWVHLAIIAAIWTSPFYLSWQFIIAGIALYHLQILILGDCVLTRHQFHAGRGKVTFYGYYLEKLGFRFNPRSIRSFLDYVLPLLILGAALLWQVQFGHPVAL